VFICYLHLLEAPFIFIFPYNICIFRIMARRGHLDGLTAQAPALMRHGSFAAGSLSSHSPLQSSSTLEMLESKLAMQTAEVEKLIMENQRLASSHVVLRQDIVDTEKEMQMIRTHLGEVQTETDLQIRDLLERIRLMEADIHSGDAVKKELHQVHMEAKRLITERQMLTLEIDNVTKELHKISAPGDGKSLPELLAELDGLRKEHHNLRFVTMFLPYIFCNCLSFVLICLCFPFPLEDLNLNMRKIQTSSKLSRCGQWK
jgi:chromosome segregation ATPase